MLPHRHLAKGQYLRRLKDLVHALGAERALDEIANSDGTDESSETGILTLLLRGAFLENLGWAEGRLWTY